MGRLKMLLSVIEKNTRNTEAEIYKFANTVSRFLYNECGWRKTERSRKAHYRGKTK